MPIYFLKKNTTQKCTLISMSGPSDLKISDLIARGTRMEDRSIPLDFPHGSTQNSSAFCHHFNGVNPCHGGHSHF